MEYPPANPACQENSARQKPEQFIDGRFFAELEKEGFIQKLWK
jgi:hypothetical protein